MANWQKEIMILANDFCLNISQVKEIVLSTDKIIVPQGEEENKYKYNKAYFYVREMITNALRRY